VSRVLIIGAAGRDFFNFLTVYKDDPGTEVVAFTAQQIPHISDRRFPASLAGPRYPHGIPIHPESRLEKLVRDLRVDACVLSYSDLSAEVGAGQVTKIGTLDGTHDDVSVVDHRQSGF
jgi:predicted GTPase